MKIHRALIALTLAAALAACHGSLNKTIGAGDYVYEDVAPAVINSAPPGATGQYTPETYYHFITGYRAEIAGEYDTALSNYRAALAQSPGSASLSMAIVTYLMRLDRTLEAEPYIDNILKDNPKNTAALTALARIQSERDEHEKSAATYSEILGIDPADVSARFHLALEYSALKRYNEAADAIMELKEDQVVNRATAFYYLGVTAMGEGQDEAARDLLTKALEMNPKLDTAWVNLAAVNERLGDNEGAVKALEQAAALMPGNMQIKEALAQLLMRLKSYDRALLVLEDIRAADPGSLETRRKIALILLNAKEYAKAEPELRAIVKADPSDEDFRFYLALTLEENGRKDEAIALYKELIAASPKEPRSYLSLGHLYSTTGRDKEAAETYEALLMADDKPEHFDILSRAYLKAEDYGRALEITGRGIKRHPDDADLRFTEAVIYEKTGRFDEMVVSLRKAIDLNPNHADALNYLGYSYADRGMNLDEALGFIERALALKPGNAYITDSLGWVYFKLGRAREALAYIEKALKIQDTEPVILEHLGDVQLHLGNRKAAAAAWKKAVSHARDDEGKEVEKGLLDRVNGKLKSLERQGK